MCIYNAAIRCRKQAMNNNNEKNKKKNVST